MSIKENIRSIGKFISHDIWNLDFSELGKVKRRFVKYAQAMILTMKGFTRGRIGREAVALSFFTTMAAVPMLALALFISGGFGLDTMLSDMLYNSFPTSTKLIEAIMNSARKIIASTEKGAFGWISFLTFVWLIFWLMMNIELAFNRIWQVNQKRKLWRRTLVYMTIMLLSPFVIILFLFGWGYYARFLGVLEGKLGIFSFLTGNLFWVVFYVLAAICLALMYKLIPHAKVRFFSAVKAAILAGLAFVLIQYLYMGTQLMVTRLSTVYGVFAFVPLFMVWVNLCWQVILFGAELSRGFTIVDNYESADFALKKLREFEEAMRLGQEEGGELKETQPIRISNAQYNEQ